MRSGQADGPGRRAEQGIDSEEWIVLIKAGVAFAADLDSVRSGGEIIKRDWCADGRLRAPGTAVQTPFVSRVAGAIWKGVGRKRDAAAGAEDANHESRVALAGGAGWRA